MSVQTTHINHVYKCNHNANLTHQKSALTSRHLSHTHAMLRLKQ